MDAVDGDLKLLADKIRRQPQLAQDMDVSVLVKELAGRWRQYRDMLEASEEVLVAAWIVRRKVEGLVDPGAEEDPIVPFDRERRPEWLEESLQVLENHGQQAARFLGRPVVSVIVPSPPPIKDASVWKLAWSFPKVPQKAVPAVQTVTRRSRPLVDYLRQWLGRLAREPRLVLQMELFGEPRSQWVAAFLAAVYLWHGQTVELHQTAPFGSLVVNKRQNDEVTHES